MLRFLLILYKNEKYICCTNPHLSRIHGSRRKCSHNIYTFFSLLHLEAFLHDSNCIFARIGYCSFETSLRADEFLTDVLTKVFLRSIHWTESVQLCVRQCASVDNQETPLCVLSSVGSAVNHVFSGLSFIMLSQLNIVNKRIKTITQAFIIYPSLPNKIIYSVSRF